MNSRNRRFSYGIVVLALALLAVLWWRQGSKSEPTQLVPSQKPTSTSGHKPLIIASPQKMLRYDEGNDPRLNQEAAAHYYQRREQMIRAYHGDGQIDKPLEVLRRGTGSRSELLTAMGAIRRQETAKAIPYLLKLLEHPDKAVCSVAAKILCWFGDKRGFDFILEQAGMNGGFETWLSALKEVFVEYKPTGTGYTEGLEKLMRKVDGEKMTQRVKAKAVAKILAEMGQASSLDVIIPMMAKYPPESADSVLALRNVNDPRVMQLASELLQNGANPRIKQAAEIVLAAHGDDAARRTIIGSVNRLAEMPQPRNADGTYKPGMEPATIGAANSAWDGDAVLALELGMVYVPSAQAVPVLQHIAMNANNVRFSETAIQVLAKIGDEAAREALWQTARALQNDQRVFASTIHTTAGKAMMLFNDATSLELSRQLFGADKHGMEAAQFFAESKGWDGLFEEGLFY